MKKRAVLINLSRGHIVDEGALHDPVVREHLGWIALDVFQTEDSLLRTLSDAILTGHELARTQENMQALLTMARKNIDAAIAGAPLPTEIALTEADALRPR